MTADDLDWGSFDSVLGGQMAAQLWDAERTGGFVEFPSRTVAGFDWPAARSIARAVDGLRSADGRRRIGYKLGWTSEVMRRSLGIEKPNWGTLWDYQVISGHLDVALLRHPKVEPEIVYRCGQGLYGPGVSADDVMAAAEGWAIGQEIVHPRFADFGFTWLDNTADNSSSQAVVVGDFFHLDVVAGPSDPASIEIVFSDGAEQRLGQASAAMGSPAEAVAWLVRALHGEGGRLEPEEIVFTGGLAAPYDVRSGAEYGVSADTLGEVRFSAGS